MNILKNIFRRSNDEEVEGETKAADNLTSRVNKGGASGADIDAANSGRKKIVFIRFQILQFI